MKGLKVTTGQCCQGCWGAHVDGTPPLGQAGLRRKDEKTWPHFLTTEKVDADQMEVHSSFSVV